MDERDYKAMNKDVQGNGVLPCVSGSASDFYTDLMNLINAYCKEGLSKPDLVNKMKYATISCELS